MELQTAIERYLRHQRVLRRSARTLEYNGEALARFARYAAEQGVTDTADLDNDLLRGYIEALQAHYPSPFTVSGRTRAVRAWGHWLELEEYVPRHPFRKVSQPQPGETTRTGLTPGQVAALLDTCDKSYLGLRDRAILLLFFSTGLRLSEMADLEIQDLDYQRQLVRVRRGKGGKARLVPLTRPVEKALDKYLRHPRRRESAHLWTTLAGRPLLRGSLYVMVKTRARKAGFKAHPHQLRHGCAVQYLRNGGRLETLKAMLGHSKLEMTLWYAQQAGVDLVRAHDTADPLRALQIRP